MKKIAALLTALVLASPVLAQQSVTPPPSPAAEATIAVTAEDVLTWEKYQLLTRLSEAQLQTMRLQNEKTLADEYAKLDARFRQHYNVGVGEIQRDGDTWRLRRPVPMPSPAPAK